MNDIKVSVCMPTYNHGRYIAQAVESVLAQQRTFSIDLVIGEDCSTDRTREIVQGLAQQHPDVIRLRLSERNVGGKANFLATIAECRGQYVAMLEGDDYWTCANKLQLQVDALDAHPEWAICFHPSACLYEDGLQGVPTYPFGWSKPVATIEDLFSANFMATSSVVFRNRLFPEFPKWFRALAIGDWPLHILNAAHGDIGYTPEVMSAYRIHGSGAWSGAKPAERLVAIFELLNAVDHHFDGKYTRSIETYRANTIRHVISQLGAVSDQVSNVAERLNSAQAQADEQTLAHARAQAQAESQSQALARIQSQHSVRASSLERDLATTKSQRNQLLNDLVQLDAKYATLADEKRVLQEFHDTWRKSIAFRVEREIRRPFRRLRRYWQSWRNGTGGQAPPAETTSSKAA